MTRFPINSQVGDPVNVCLVFVPEDYPPGDDRGKIYAPPISGTGESWSCPTRSISCGGA